MHILAVATVSVYMCVTGNIVLYQQMLKKRLGDMAPYIFFYIHFPDSNFLLMFNSPFYVENVFIFITL